MILVDYQRVDFTCGDADLWSMKKKKKENSKPEKVETTPPAPVPQQELPEEKPFDFGGLPARDLKKNLGCG
jgi:hypothetical protein